MLYDSLGFELSQYLFVEEAFVTHPIINWGFEHFIGTNNQVSVHKENNPALYLTFIIGF